VFAGALVDQVNREDVSNMVQVQREMWVNTIFS
jgi:hypothetical protein